VQVEERGYGCVYVCGMCEARQCRAENARHCSGNAASWMDGGQGPREDGEQLGWRDHQGQQILRSALGEWAGCGLQEAVAPQGGCLSVSGDGRYSLTIAVAGRLAVVGVEGVS